MPRVYIILLNWNGWKDTVQCLESIFRSSYHDYRVIVCDNDSGDNSIAKIKQWASGDLLAETDVDDALKPLIQPPIAKPLRFVEHDRGTAENISEINENISLMLVHTGGNWGFSGGNNVGITCALKHNADYIWLLNNDTLITAHTMEKLVNLMDNDSSVGLAGNLIFSTTHTMRMQAYGGGRLAPLIGTDRFVYNAEEIDYISGTSLFIRSRVIREIGLLDDAFFFYWEDVDYSTRALKNGWKLAVAEGTELYHKFSATVGSQSLKSDLFKAASLKQYFKKHRKLWLIPVTVNVCGMLLKRLFRRQFNRLVPIVKEVFK